MFCRRKDQATQRRRITGEEEGGGGGRIKKQETFRVGILGDTVTPRIFTWVKVKVAHKIPRMLAVILVVENNCTVNYGQNIESLLNCILRTNLSFA